MAFGIGPWNTLESGSLPLLLGSLLIAAWAASLGTVGWAADRRARARARSAPPHARDAENAEDAEAVRLRRVLEERDSLLRALFDTCPMLVGVVQLLPDDVLHIWDNPPSLAFFRGQGAPDRPRPVRASELGVLPSTIRFWTEKYLESRNTGEPARWLYKHDSTDGDHFWFGVVVAPVPWDGHDNCFFYVIDDITPQKKLEQELRDAVVAAEEAARAKSDFLTVMSHEIRTPLTVILGFADSLLSPDVTPERLRKGLDAIRRNAASLVRILEDIGDFSRIERRVLPMHFDAVDVGLLVRDTVRVYAEAAARKNVALDIIVQPCVSDAFVTDARRVGQILSALVDNAVKYSHNGRVTVDVRAGHSPKEIVIDVSDEGIGMTPEETERLFQAFTQLEPPLTRTHGGIGLGLYFARELARLLGGELELVDTALGRGSRFRVTLVSPQSRG